MQISRAVAAATSTAASLGLAVDHTVVLHDSNKLTVRLLPSDVVARVAPVTDHVAQFELDLAQRLAGSAAAALEPARVHERDGFAITLWTYCESRGEVAPPDYATALVRLHKSLRTVEIPTPHFTDRVEQAQRLVANRDHTPALTDADREFLGDTLRSTTRVITGRAEQVLHGEPHPGNLLSTENGPLFIDLETCCRGPVEFDLAHAPEEVGDHYPGVDQELLRSCRLLVLAMITAWRWDRDDRFPDGRRLGTEWLSQLRAARQDADRASRSANTV